MSRYEDRIKARELRRQGEGIKAIATLLHASRGSVSSWCRDVKLTKGQMETLRDNAIAAGNRGRLMGAATNKQRRLDTIATQNDQAKKLIGSVSKRDLLIMSAALFWAEGAKTGSRFMFANADIDMVLIIKKYLIEVEKIPLDRLVATVQINRVHENRIEEVLKFWSSGLGLPMGQFTKPVFINVTPKKVYENHDTHYGLIRMGVRKGSVLQYRLLGYINALKLNNNLLV